ncbi:MAG: hypothetical protein K0R92_3190 [Lachnospiraceae bacterium]|nr:hypothetical protein [Lachnospiraceae bacterium]
MVKRFIERLLFMSLGRKLGIILAVFAIVPSYFIYSHVMTIYEDDMVKVASRNLQSIVKANNSLIDTTLNRIEDISYLFLSNKECYDCFSKMDQFSVSDFLKQERLISDVLGKQFMTNDTVYAKYLYTSKWMFGGSSKSSMNVTFQDIQRSILDQKAVEAGGQATWITGYDYGEWFQTEYLNKKENYEYQYPITMVRQMNFQYTNNGNLYYMKSNQERPILIVHVLEETLSSLYEPSVNYEGSIYAVANEEGRIISSDSDAFPITELVPEQILKLRTSSGYTSYWINDMEYLLCYDTMEERNWFSFCLIPMTELIQHTKAEMQSSQMWVTIILLSASVLIAVGRILKYSRRALITWKRKLQG